MRCYYILYNILIINYIYNYSFLHPKNVTSNKSNKSNILGLGCFNPLIISYFANHAFLFPETNDASWCSFDAKFLRFRFQNRLSNCIFKEIV